MFVCLCTYVRTHTHTLSVTHCGNSLHGSPVVQKDPVLVKGRVMYFSRRCLFCEERAIYQHFNILKERLPPLIVQLTQSGKRLGPFSWVTMVALGTCRVVGFWKRAETARTPSLHECLKANVPQNGDRVFLLSDGCVSLGNAVCTHGYVETVKTVSWVAKSYNDDAGNVL